jgi:hypothetical protein
MDYHHETQPMPNPLSRFFHGLPRAFHRSEVVGNYVAQLVAPFLLFLPQPVAGLGALLMIGTQAYLLVSGNYAWLNVLTMVAAVAAVPDAFLGVLLPSSAASGPLAAPPTWFVAVVLALTGAVVVLSWWPVRNLLGRRQLMNVAFNLLHLVGSYGAFGSVTRERHEIVLEGTDARVPATDAVWREYEFKGKPVTRGDAHPTSRHTICGSTG